MVAFNSLCPYKRICYQYINSGSCSSGTKELKGRLGPILAHLMVVDKIIQIKAAHITYQVFLRLSCFDSQAVLWFQMEMIPFVKGFYEGFQAD